MKTKVLSLLLLLLPCAATGFAQKSRTVAMEDFDVSRYDVVWDSTGIDATASMPVGNGDLGANVYVVNDGDLFLLLGKTDAFDWNGNVWKTGRVRISINPNPFRQGTDFRQTLNLAEGCIDIVASGNAAGDKVRIRIWTDANNPVYRVDMQSDTKVDVKVEPEFWKRSDKSFDHLETIGNQLVWYHSNGERSCYQHDLKHYEIEDMLANHPDPFKHRTFGCVMQAKGLKLDGNSFAGSGKSFSIEIASTAKQVENPAEWVNETRGILAGYDRKHSFSKHCEWWKTFWNRSWITASDNTLSPEEREKPAPPAAPGMRGEKDGGYIVAQSYNVSRYIMACQGRGEYQTQFNGGIFTTPFPNYWDKDGTLFGEDQRAWGNRFTFQNQRLLYWPMLAAGDFETMRPFINYYFSVLDLRKAITKQWFGHEGAYYRENIQLTGAEMDDSPITKGKPPKTVKGEPLPEGWYHHYHFNSGLELTVMALDFYRYSRNETFMRDTVIPLAREVIRFFDLHYERDGKGKLVFYPSQVLETWWEATNPATDISGLHYLIDGLLQEKDIPPTDRKTWERLKRQLPEVPLASEDGKQYILPAEKFAYQKNNENGERYAVFPFSLFGVGHGTEDIVSNTIDRRLFKNSFGGRCWTQDQIMYAYAGMSEEAKEGLIHRWMTYSKYLRLPMFGAEDPDYVPDFDHNGAGSVALQRMAVQEVGDKIYVLPAWPQSWDGSFKLHLRDCTVIKGAVKNGKVENIDITPEERKKDVVIAFPSAQ
ncbi:MAG: DUF5703 domain-containing protein [Dysgonamonadaceae bacterium]|jgi:hypothetical protein|nr:DUF5703 domain-containing protein [Dysgonamonadaceae bacterium]